MAVTNTGSRSGAEVVQLYYTDPVCTVTPPVRQLLGFARVSLDPGETATVVFDVHTDRFAVVGADLTRVVEPGTIELLVGSSSTDIRHAVTIDIVGQTRTIHGRRGMITP